jgi:imidazoleglycerol phosphate synthase cyclase subunit
MLTTRIIPCLDIRDGRIVKGIRFAGLRDAGDPAERAAEYQAQGADEIAVLDVSATMEGRRAQRETIAAIRERLAIPVTAGGGIRSADDAGNVLRSGADKVTINSAAVESPAILNQIADRFGSQCAVLAIDAQRGDDGRWWVRTHSGSRRQQLDAVAWAEEGQRRGAGEILLTSFDRDGTRDGYDLELVAAIRAAVDVPVVASGGASHPSHMIEAVQAGADAVLAASIFHDGDWTVDAVKARLAESGIEVRR